MTSEKQKSSNRRNAMLSTGLLTRVGKLRSRKNALRHGLTATVLAPTVDDAREYRRFVTAIRAEYGSETIVHQELVTRLASLLWRLRRSALIEAGLLEIQAELMQKERAQRASVVLFPVNENGPSRSPVAVQAEGLSRADRPASAVELARCFLRLNHLESHVLDRLGRYEMSLWVQARQVLAVLANGFLRSNKP